MANLVGMVRRPLALVHYWWQRRSMPAVLHVTHWKAGSQWIHRILKYCCSELTVRPRENNDHVLKGPIRQGMIYPTIYAMREQLQHLSYPDHVRRFVVIRDPRDSVVSLYFSTKNSHKNGSPIVLERRAHLQTMSQEDGLCFTIENSAAIAAIIRSWLGADDPLIRYEDLLRDDERILERVLLGHCQLPVSPRNLRAAIRENSFERLTGGRARGQEDIAAHERKGVAGDWQNYFTPRVKEVFHRHFGDVLVASGYERTNDW